MCSSRRSSVLEDKCVWRCTAPLRRISQKRPPFIETKEHSESCKTVWYLEVPHCNYHLEVVTSQLYSSKDSLCMDCLAQTKASPKWSGLFFGEALDPFRNKNAPLLTRPEAGKQEFIKQYSLIKISAVFTSWPLVSSVTVADWTSLSHRVCSEKFT